MTRYRIPPPKRFRLDSVVLLDVDDRVEMLTQNQIAELMERAQPDDETGDD